MINKTRFKGDFESLLEIQFLAPTGAQGVTLCVRLSVRHNMLKSSLEQLIFIFLDQRALGEHSESTQRALREH